MSSSHDTIEVTLQSYQLAGHDTVDIALNF